MSDAYMHLLDGEPAVFQDGHIVFAGRRVNALANSLRQIRREQAADKLWCTSRGIQFSDVAYRYVRVARKALKP